MEENQGLNSILTPVRGLDNGMELDTYHGRPELSAHNLMDVSISPRYADFKKNNPVKQTEAMANGHIIHDALEDIANFEKKYAVEPDVDKRTKKGKESLQSFQDSNEGKTIISQKQYDMGRLCSDAAWNHPEAGIFLEHSKKELSGFGQCLRVPCKARPDLDCTELSADLVDIKSRQPGKAGRDEWLKDFFFYKTYIQVGLQVEIWRQLGFKVTGYYHLLVESGEPFQVNVIPLDPEWIEIGIYQVYEAVQKWQLYLDAGRPPGYGRNQLPLGAPMWMKKKLGWSS